MNVLTTPVPPMRSVSTRVAVLNVCVATDFLVMGSHVKMITSAMAKICVVNTPSAKIPLGHTNALAMVDLVVTDLIVQM
jgi:hypothetical protein